MRTKLSDWKVGEKVVFESSHGGTQELVVKAIGRKLITIGREDSDLLASYKFQYEGNYLRFTGGYSHNMYTPEEYKLRIEYDQALKGVHAEMDRGLHGSDKWTEENIKRLGLILELVKAIKGTQ